MTNNNDYTPVKKEYKIASKEKQEAEEIELKEKQEQEQEQQYLIKPQYIPKVSGNLTSLISSGFDDNKQMSIFTSDKGVMYYGASYKYKDKNTKLNAMYR